jgi:hypothetical protein
VLKLNECADSFKKLSDTEAINQQETDVKNQLNHTRRQFLGYIKSCYVLLQRESRNTFQYSLVKERLKFSCFSFIDSIEQSILSSRPTSNDSDYQEKIRAYCDMMKLTMELMKNLQETCDHIFSEYFKFFKDLSDAVEQGKDTKKMVEDFKTKIKKTTDDTWQPFFDVVNKWKRKLDNPTNASSHQNVRSAQKSPTHYLWNLFK